MRLTERDHAEVNAAVMAAEARTDGEIVTIVAPSSDSYHDVVLHWAMLLVFLVLALVALRPDILLSLRAMLDGGWRHEYPQGELLTALLLLLAVKFLAARLAFAWMPLRMLLTPRATKARRVRRRALSYFKVGTEHRTASRTGVLLYLSLAEHQAEIVADAAIHAKVAPETWGDAMAALIEAVRDGRPGDGMAAAVEQIGAVLAEHFPRTDTDPNELPDRLIAL
ncbi:hypothetical protein CLG96_06945 [Sphingomonas oleivorans]|uniref:TPM domain-containing protein n=1 Tax=Sphingomonas oleivorans TaxID=1735121 RepID=A0A2T5G000_9SPHN|nr:hypothetical protein [Sphingomonas oleivorans]PTQ12268.1 hypothetical protein CLG96_06945 [Sphingomonas oleivorans]